MTNPLQKYVDALDKPKQEEFVQQPITVPEANYLLKSLDYLAIFADRNSEPDLVEQPIHDYLEGKILDIAHYAPEEDTRG